MSQNLPCLVAVDELAACYQNSEVIVVDCRFSLADTALGEQQYRAAHIPGACYFHLDRDMSAAKGVHGGRHPLPTIEQFVSTLRAAGVNRDSRVVCYDDQRFAFAARLWWLLRALGHQRVQVLDGGFKAWQAAGLPLSDAPPIAGAGNFVAGAVAWPALEFRSVRDALPLDNVMLIDSREAPRYRGEQEPIDPLAGHIPGAINKPWAEVTNADGFALDEAAQRQRWNDVATQQEIVVYCGSGVTACVNVLSLAMIGRDDAKLYAGSWSDWCSYVV